MRHTKEIRNFVRDGDYEVTEGGILIHNAIMARGAYYHSSNGGEAVVDHNLLTAESIAHILNVTFGSTAKATNFYLALFAGNTTPAANWTAANFASNATEIVSTTEGYTETTRPAWTPAAASAGKIGNLASRAAFTIKCTSPINIYGAALLTSNVRGGTAGVLLSASRFASTRVESDGNTFELGYEVELTDS